MNEFGRNNDFSRLELSASGLLANYTYFRSKLEPKTKLLVLMKANGYGHGAVELAAMLQQAGADYLAVALPVEGIELRKAGISLPILVLTAGTDAYEDIIKYRLEPGIPNMYALTKIRKVLSKAGIKDYPVHIKLDTGMHRLGFMKSELDQLCQSLGSIHEIKVKSIYSHLAAADEPQWDDFTLGQIKLFTELADDIASGLGYRPMRHILNSAGTERFTQYQMDMVRIGIGMYGISAVGSDQVKPVASLKCPILQIKEISEGTIGYGRHGILRQVPSKIATIRIGYGDGVDRRLGYGNASFMVNGHAAPTIGSICMDMCMLDITGIEAKVGDIVTVFGDSPTVLQLADKLGTIPYELLTRIDRRLKRVIVK